MTRGSDLRATVRDGKRIRSGCLDARVVITTSHQSRIGFVVPKHGRSAVRRNQLKRRLRELARQKILAELRDGSARKGMDVVMRTLPSAYHASYEDLAAAVEALRARIARLASATSNEVATDGSART